jgi:hypothetical protein
VRVKLVELRLEAASGPPDRLLALSPEPAPVPAVPDGAPIQDVAVPPAKRSSAGGEGEPEVAVLSFAMVSPHAQLLMQRSVRDYYALDGEAGLHRLLDGIVGDPRRPWKGRGRKYLQAPINVRREDDYRYQLRDMFLTQRQQIRDLARDVQGQVAATAVSLTRERMTQSRQLTLRECRRYAGFGDDRAATAALNLDLRTLPLLGADLPRLADALLRIDDARGSVQGAEQELDRALGPVRAQRAEWAASRFRALSPVGAMDVNVVSPILREAAERFPDPPAAALARQTIAEQQAELMATVAAEARELPLLFRVWQRTDAAGQAREAIATRDVDVTVLQKALSTGAFRDAVWAALTTTWAAAGATEARLRDQSLEVWDYWPLIASAIRKLAIPPGTVEWQAVQERLQEHRVSAVSALSQVAGLVDVAVTLTAAAPPVAAAVGTIALVLQATEWVIELWRHSEERDAFNCTLDPSASFAVEPSYAGLLVGLVLLGLAAKETARTVGRALP